VLRKMAFRPSRPGGAIRPDRKVIGFPTDANQPAMRHRAMGISPGETMVDNVQVIHQRTESDCRFAAMCLIVDDFDAALKAITGPDFSDV
jgi:hypothetical protein